MFCNLNYSDQLFGIRLVVKVIWNKASKCIHLISLCVVLCNIVLIYIRVGKYLYIARGKICIEYSDVTYYNSIDLTQ